MKIATSRTLKAVIDVLASLTADGAMERGRAEAITEAIRQLRQANQKQDQRAMSLAVDRVARLVLREFE
jgi:hypothetical protein